MTKQEFLEELRETLLAEGAGALVAENMNYYDQYIESEKAKGVSEEEVLEALGSPRLIGRSILDAGGYVVDGIPDENPGSANNAKATEGYGDTGNAGGSGRTDGRYGSGSGSGERPEGQFYLSGGAAIALLVLILVVVLLVFFGLIRLLWPILFPLLIVMMVMRMFSGR